MIRAIMECQFLASTGLVQESSSAKRKTTPTRAHFERVSKFASLAMTAADEVSHTAFRYFQGPCGYRSETNGANLTRVPDGSACSGPVVRNVHLGANFIQSLLAFRRIAGRFRDGILENPCILEFAMAADFWMA